MALNWPSCVSSRRFVASAPTAMQDIRTMDRSKPEAINGYSRTECVLSHRLRCVCSRSRRHCMCTVAFVCIAALPTLFSDTGATLFDH